MKLLTALRAEMLKTKRTASFYFTLIAAALIPAIILLNVLTDGGDLAAIRKDGMNAVFEMGAERSYLVFLPMFVILVCTLLPQIEYRNNTWKQVLAAPHSKGTVFLAKFLNVNGLILLFLVANLVFLLVVIVVAHFAHPTLNLLSQPLNVTGFFIRTGNAYLTVLAMCAFQFWLGLRFRNFITPIAIGFVLWFTGMMMIFEFDAAIINLFPYSFQVFPILPKLQPKVTQVAWTSVAYAMLFLVLGFMDFRSRRLSS
jgi:hypothetical protein